MSDPVVHFELPADDVARAQDFYREAFGWTMNPMPGMGYVLVSTTPTGDDGRPTEPGRINGGMLARQGFASAPIVTVAVPDIEAALRRVVELGGAVVRGAEPVGEMGVAAYFTDTEGNVVGLWQNA